MLKVWVRLGSREPQKEGQLFPIIGLPHGNPNFWQFMLNPEQYIYPTMILILDGRAMLDDFLAESSDIIAERGGEKSEEEDDLLDEVLEVQRALQSIKTPDDFYDMVEVYRRANRLFSKGQEIESLKTSLDTKT